MEIWERVKRCQKPKPLVDTKIAGILNHMLKPLQRGLTGSSTSYQLRSLPDNKILPDIVRFHSHKFNAACLCQDQDPADQSAPANGSKNGNGDTNMAESDTTWVTFFSNWPSQNGQRRQHGTCWWHPPSPSVKQNAAEGDQRFRRRHTATWSVKNETKASNDFQIINYGAFAVNVAFGCNLH